MARAGAAGVAGLSLHGIYSVGRFLYIHGKKYAYSSNSKAKQAEKRAISRRSQPSGGYNTSRRMVRKKKGLKQQVKELKRVAEADMGTHIHKVRYTDSLICGVNQNAMLSHYITRMTDLENVIAQLRYYNPSTPTTLVTADGASGSYQKEFMFTKIYSRVTARNNYQVPVKLRMYIVKPKKDTSITALTAVTNGLTDIGAPSSTSTMIYPTDSIQFNDLWSIKKSMSKTLLPGRECSIVNTEGSFQYDPSLNDSHSLLYQQSFNNHAILFRIEGVIGHDTTADEQTSLQAGIDFELLVNYEVKYAAGADIRFIYLDDNGSTSFTNAGVCSNQPVSDNQQYSLS